MPRYFFHMSGPASFDDSTGVELADDDAAWSQAITACGEFLRDLDGKMPDRSEMRVTVVNEKGRPVATLRFTGERQSDALVDDFDRRIAAATGLALDRIKDIYAPNDYGIFADELSSAALNVLKDGDRIGRGLVVRRDGTE